MPAERPIYGAGGKWKQAEAARAVSACFLFKLCQGIASSFMRRSSCSRAAKGAPRGCAAALCIQAEQQPHQPVIFLRGLRTTARGHRTGDLFRRHPRQHHSVPSVPCARRIHMLFPLYCPAAGLFYAAAALWTGPQERQDHVHRVQPGKRRLPAPVCRLQWQAEAQRPHGRNNNVQGSAHTIPARGAEAAGCGCRFPRGRKAAVLCVPGDAGTASPSAQGWPQAAATDAPSANVCPTAARPPRLPPFHWRQPHCSISFSECQIILSI